MWAVTELVMRLLGVGSCLQPGPSGPGPNHTVTCTDCSKEFLVFLGTHSPLPLLGSLTSLPPGRRDLSLPCHWPQAGWSFNVPFSTASPPHPVFDLPASSYPWVSVVSCSIWVCWGPWWGSPDKLDFGACAAAWCHDTSSWLHPLLAGS